MWIWLHTLLSRTKRPPDEVIGEKYLLRWHLIPRNRWANVYLHKFIGPDSGRDCHDHPWHNLTIVLWGRYWEETLSGTRYEVGKFLFRRPESAHLIYKVDAPCWTLFLTGPRLRDWGFYVKQPNGTRRWVRWEEYKG